ncbi:hypothetical protein ACIQOW_18615 [Kitasatospora sp. NPDC091335]|uniref:hypothetical protein n=1 Tax=Kitasatospora sp. NPDC091335 TaxID=3364085 RepID=UPI0038233224
MTSMLGRELRGYRYECRYAGRGCTCFYYTGEFGRKAARLRRRRARRVEARTWPDTDGA